jgi:predicted RNA polymerase sigma factor
MEAARVVDQVARTSYGRLVAFLSARTRDVAAAEDALSEAFQAALTTWPESGVPERPEAWLLAVARRRQIDAGRHTAVQQAAQAELQRAAAQTAVGQELPDERLGLLMLCAHPAIDVAVRTPLMLQTVLGLDATTIASAFLVAPASMGQRLVRAKRKIREAGIPFAVPERAEWPARLRAVLEAIYAAYGAGWEEASGRQGLANEALWLARVLVELLPDEEEALGLLALLLYCETRRPARRGPEGQYVPLSQQDVRRWRQDWIAEAERHLERAARRQRPGRFQWEAAIQSAHSLRAVTGRVDWEAVTMLYEALVRNAATVGAHVGWAAAMAEAAGPAAGLAILERLEAEQVAGYQPYWAVRAHLLRRSGNAGAQTAYTRAAGLTEDPAVRAYLLQEMMKQHDDD